MAVRGACTNWVLGEKKKIHPSAGGIWKGFSVCFSAAWGRVFVQCLVCSQQCLWRGRHFAQVGRKGQVLGLERQGGVTVLETSDQGLIILNE